MILISNRVVIEDKQLQMQEIDKIVLQEAGRSKEKINKGKRRELQFPCLMINILIIE